MCTISILDLFCGIMVSWNIHLLLLLTAFPFFRGGHSESLFSILHCSLYLLLWHQLSACPHLLRPYISSLAYLFASYLVAPSLAFVLKHPCYLYNVHGGHRQKTPQVVDQKVSWANITPSMLTMTIRWPWASAAGSPNILFSGCVRRLEGAGAQPLHTCGSQTPESPPLIKNSHCCVLRSCGLLTLIQSLSAVKLWVLALTCTLTRTTHLNLSIEQIHPLLTMPPTPAQQDNLPVWTTSNIQEWVTEHDPNPLVQMWQNHE